VSGFSFIPLRSRLLAAAAVVAGLVAGGCSAALIALINTALHRNGLSRTILVVGFSTLVAGKVASNALARLLLNIFTQETMADLCRNLSRKVVAAPLRHLERVGIPRILATLTDDIAWIGWAAQNAPTLATNLAILVGCALYLGWLSWRILVIVMLVVGIGMIGYRTLTARAYRHLKEARDTRDVLFQHFRALTEGVKELKLHTGRREAFLSERIAATTHLLRGQALAGVRHHIVADTWSQILFYGLLGGVLFMSSTAQGLKSETVTGYVVAVLYMMTPVWGVMETWPILARARIALQKVVELEISLAASRSDEETPSERLEIAGEWQRLHVDGATFTYPPDVDGQAFVLGPIDLTLRRGELVFLVGGNGSGKSTFVKVLTGLYSPQVGTIRLDGLAITDKNREWYCQHFSAVFSDFYLFDTLLGLDGSDLDARAHRRLVELELDAKIRIKDGALSTTALSQGQRKRLALLTAFLEDRPIYVFDEWAADQDPHYREIFYKRLLPELKALGKTIVVISHDDRYYGLGDRIVKLEYGKLVAEPAGGVASAVLARDPQIGRARPGFGGMPAAQEQA
jgi:putative ATP-binding cassette transporter